MAWVKLDDLFPDHPKVLEAGPMAAWLYVCSITYANRHLTDGFIPDSAVPRLADLKNTKNLAATLVKVNLWERSEGGYLIHDYLDYQPSAAKVTHERAATAARVASWKHRNRGVTNGSVTPLPRHYQPVSNAALTPPPVPVPVPVPEEDVNLEGESTVTGAAFAAKSSRTPAPRQIILTDAARETLEQWRAAHGKRSPPKLNPTQAAKLEKAITELGPAWLGPAMTWSAERGIPEFDKAINAAYTARQNSAQGDHQHGEARQHPGWDGPGPRGAPPRTRGSSASEDDPFAKYTIRYDPAAEDPG